jgi:hypothetical protein
MPKQIPHSELDVLLSVVGRYRDGVSIEELTRTADLSVSRRTLQRRLAQLVAQGRVAREGRGPARRYRLPIRSEIRIATTEATEVSNEGDIPLSSDAQAIQNAVGMPLQRRKTVGYSRKFLDDYRPNESFYLPIEVRDHLDRLGHVPSADLPAGTYVRQILNRLLIDLSWNSSRLEGNTYSLLETERLLELGESAEGKNVRDAQMIVNHKTAIELLVDQAEEIGFNRYTICNLHALLSDNLLGDPQAGGRVRLKPVGISGTTFLPLEGPQVDECFQQLLDTADAIENPYEQAFFVMVQLPYLQAFEDVNKRVSRLAANIPLIRHNLCPISFIDVPRQVYIDGLLGVYELNRVELLRDVFVWAYERSCIRYSAVRQSLGEPDPFRMRYRNLLREIINAVVRDRLDRRGAGTFILQQTSERVPREDHARFVEVVETEIISLHEGNIARYQLRPSEYRAWRENWT